VTDGATVEVSASIGVHGLGPDDPELGADEVLAAADAAMYAVKRTREPGVTGIRTSVATSRPALSST
jgi:GGDEF domain-containing protein